MSIFKNRLPDRDELRLVFIGCAFLVHVWAILNMLEALPAWIIRMSMYELAGVIAYVLVFALLESLLVFVGLVLVAAILPRSILRDDFALQGTILILVTGLWSAAVHYNYGFIVEHRRLLPLFGGGYLASILFFAYLARRFRKAAIMMRSILQRLEILVYVYVFFDVLGLFVIFFRNL